MRSARLLVRKRVGKETSESTIVQMMQEQARRDVEKALRAMELAEESMCDRSGVRSAFDRKLSESRRGKKRTQHVQISEHPYKKSAVHMNL